LQPSTGGKASRAAHAYNRFIPEPVDLAAILERAAERERHFRASANGTPNGLDPRALLREAHADVAALVE
jgi:hypothetical protein